MALSPSILSISALPSISTSDSLHSGVHLRWTNHPLLGFPNGPVEISRAALDKDKCPRLPLHISELGGGTSAPLPYSIPSGQVVWCRPMVGSAGTLATQLNVAGIRPEQVVGGFLGLKGFVPVQYGAALDPTEIWVTAAGANAIRITGPGRILSASAISLDCARKLKFQRLDMVGPPFDGLQGYQSAPVDDPEGEAERRVREGAPVNTSLVDAMHATSLSPGPNNDDREWDRVLRFVDGALKDRYAKMLDTPGSPLSHRQPEALSRGSSEEVATLNTPSYALLMAATRDASVARWAGYSVVDLVNPDLLESGHGGVYRIRASFDPARVFREANETAAILAALELHRIRSHDLNISNPGLVLEAFVAVIPPAQPPLPAPGSMMTQHVRWLSASPALRRLIDVEFTPPVGAVAYAWFRQVGSPFEPMNANRDPTDYRVLDPGSRRADSSDRWVLTDLNGPPIALNYGVAAMDAFGRWSPWTTKTADPGPLVRPPPPVLEAQYLVAPVSPVDSLPRAGSVQITIPVPGELPPGCPYINRVHIRLESLSGALISSLVEPIGSRDSISVLIPGPALARSEIREVRVAAQFEAGGLLSSDGVARVTAADSRPPIGLTIEPSLRWTTRADARDSSRTVLKWGTRHEHQGYRVYVATSRTLIDHFTSLGASGEAALASLSSPTAAMRDVVAAIAPHTNNLPRSAFELVTSRMIDADPSGASYELVIPGRSRLLYVVRISAVGPNNVDEDWSGPPGLFFVAAPPTIKIQAPELVVRGETHPMPSAHVIATLRRGQRAVAWRLFRTTRPDLAVADSMSEVMTEAINLPPSEAPPEVPAETAEDFKAPLAMLEYHDTGPTKYGPDAGLRPWRSYIYRAQIQGEPEPGGPPGVWSDLSIPVSTVVIPEAHPPVAIVSATRSAIGVEVGWRCELPARRTAVGDFRFRILVRQEGNSVAEESGVVSALDLFAHIFKEDSDLATLPRLEVFVETIDPVGRRTLSEPAIVEAES